MRSLVFGLFCLVVGTTVSALDVRTLVIDQPPKFELKDGVLTGLANDIMRGIEKVDPQIHFVLTQKTYTPIARVEKSLEDGDIDAYVGFTKNPERAAKFLMTVPLFQVTNVFIGAAGDTAAFTTLDQFRAINQSTPILAVSNSAQAQYLRKEGFTVDDGSTTFAIAFNKLLAGRGRFLMVPDLAGYAYLQANGLTGKYKVFPSVTGVDDQYFCFSKKADPALVEAVTAALTKMKSSGALGKIVAPYLVH